MITRKELARLIDHALLNPSLTAEDVRRGCQDAIKHSLFAVTVNPAHVRLAAETLQGSSVRVCSVVSFPFGLSTTDAKVFETKTAISQGAVEIDMVMNFSALRSGLTDFVLNDIRSVVEEAERASKEIVVKVILETCYLSQEEKTRACEVAIDAGADFVKTSTGFGSSGATVEDVRLLRKVVGRSIGVKAAGGIRSLQHVLSMIEAGANRIGTSSSVFIIEALNP